jgi:hypothetical protein
MAARGQGGRSSSSRMKIALPNSGLGFEKLHTIFSRFCRME